MSTLQSRPASVNRSRRPFGAGLVDPEPVKPAWEIEVRTFLRSRGYDAPCNVDAAISWIVTTGSIDRCPVVDRQDRPTINAIVRRHEVAAADVVEDEPQVPLPRRFEPALEDRAWWADFTDRRELARLRDARYDRQHAEARTVARHSLGLIPPAAAAELMSRSLIGHSA